jgi:hypothetical protein
MADTPNDPAGSLLSKAEDEQRAPCYAALFSDDSFWPYLTASILFNYLNNNANPSLEVILSLLNHCAPEGCPYFRKQMLNSIIRKMNAILDEQNYEQFVENYVRLCSETDVANLCNRLFLSPDIKHRLLGILGSTNASAFLKAVGGHSGRDNAFPSLGQFHSIFYCALREANAPKLYKDLDKFYRTEATPLSRAATEVFLARIFNG